MLPKVLQNKRNRDLALLILAFVLLSLVVARLRAERVAFIPDKELTVIGGLGGELLKRPLAAITDQDHVYVADSSNQRIRVFGLDGRFIMDFSGRRLKDPDGSALVYPSALAMSPTGQLYVADPVSEKVVVFNKNGNAVKQLDFNQGGRRAKPLGLAFGPRGNLYITEAHEGKIVVFNPKDKLLREFSQGKLKFPNGIVVGKQGRVYVADSNNTRIIVFDKKDTPIMEWRVAGKREFVPRGIALDGFGRLIVADPLNSRIVFLNGDGRTLNELSMLPNTEALFLPSHVFVDKNKLIITDRGLGQVFILNLTGAEPQEKRKEAPEAGNAAHLTP